MILWTHCQKPMWGEAVGLMLLFWSAFITVEGWWDGKVGKVRGWWGGKVGEWWGGKAWEAPGFTQGWGTQDES